MRATLIGKFTLACLLAALPALPQALKKATSVEGITEYQSANGLKVLLVPDPSKETITVNVTYMVGSRHEGNGETGMAHLLEHLVFKGTPKHTNIPQELTAHGARPNGSTSFDRTNYFETFSATDVNLEWALDLEADRMVNSFIARKDLDSEMTVVRNEWERGENDARRVLMQNAMSAAYRWHGYGKSTIGARSDIENVPIDRLQAFYRNYYQPDNATLVVAGKIDEAKTLKLIEKYFNAIPRPTRKLYATYTAEPVQDGERVVSIRRVGDIQSVAALFHVPAGSHEDFAAVAALAQILGGQSSGRLYKALVETKKATSANGFAYQLKEPGVIFFSASVRKENSLDEVRSILVKTVDEILVNPATQPELDRIKQQYAKSFDLTLGNAEQLALSLSEWEARGDWRLIFLHRDRVAKVTLDDVKRVAAAYLKPTNRTIGLFLPDEKPERAVIPATPDLKAALKDYKGNAAMAQGEAFDPSPANIDARSRRGQIGNGLKLVMIPKKTRANSVHASLTLHFGDENNLKNLGAVPNMTHSMLMLGAGGKGRQEIRDAIDKLKAQVMISGTHSSTVVSIQATRENLPAVLNLVGEILKNPTFPEAELSRLKQQSLAGVESRRTDPQALASLALQRSLSPYPKGDVRYIPTFEDEIAEISAVTLDAVKKFHSEFYGASKAELAVVGDFDPEATQKQAAALFGNWNSKAHYARIESPFQKIAPVNNAIQTPDKANATVYAGLRINLSDDDADYPAMVMANYMLGGGFLNSRLAVRIRQKDGLSYGVSSGFQTAPRQKNSRFLFAAICAPENAPKVEKAFKEEIARALKDGFTEDEVQAAKKGWLQSQQVSRSQDAGLSAKINLLSFYDRTLAFDAGVEKQVQGLTASQISDALRRNLKLEDVSIFKAGDFKKANVQF